MNVTVSYFASLMETSTTYARSEIHCIHCRTCKARVRVTHDIFRGHNYTHGRAQSLSKQINWKQSTYVTLSTKTCLIEELISRALVRRYANAWRLSRAYDICRSWASTVIFFCRSLCSVSHEYYHKRVTTADIGWHCLFLHKAGFRRRLHICTVLNISKLKN